MATNFDLIILSNGPGEITTWVLPVVQQIHQYQDDNNINRSNLRISLILSPCPNATGNEVKLAQQIAEIDRVQGEEDFFAFLLWGKTKEDWSWFDQGLVLFLGGDQFFPLIIAKRLKYQTLIYAEWSARWYRYINKFAVMNQSLLADIPTQFHDKFTIVGDLMADVLVEDKTGDVAPTKQITIGLLPGSKASKLTQGVPFLMAIAEYITQHHQNKETEFVIPVAPTINKEILASYGQKKNNNFIEILGDVTGELIEENNTHYLLTSGGLKIKLITHFPCYEELKQCSLCLTTVGANTAQLGALAIPMIIVIPTYQLSAMKSWDGLPGLLANLPLVGDRFAKLINKIVINYTIENKKLYGWPNIWAKKEIVPELIGNLTVKQIGDLSLDLLNNEEKLIQMKNNLQEVRGDSGASMKITHMIFEMLNLNDRQS